MNVELNDEQVLSATRAWVEHAVIGLNLCPFAKAVHVQGRIHYMVCRAADSEALLAILEGELEELVESDLVRRETTVIVVPQLWPEFTSMLAFLDEAEDLLRRKNLDGILQIASFHPTYQFAGTEEDDIENCTNRSPFPILHLLRETSIDRAVQAMPDPAAIYQANIRTLQTLGHDGWESLNTSLIRGR
jgi:uncharacterized protein